MAQLRNDLILFSYQGFVQKMNASRNLSEVLIGQYIAGIESEKIVNEDSPYYILSQKSSLLIIHNKLACKIKTTAKEKLFRHGGRLRFLANQNVLESLLASGDCGVEYPCILIMVYVYLVYTVKPIFRGYL